MISYKIYSDENKSNWDNFIDISSNGTLFNYRTFIDYHENPDFKDMSLIFYKKNRIVSVLPAGLVGGQFISHPGTSFGGFIYKQNLSFNDANNIAIAFKGFLAKYTFSNVKITLTPRCYNVSYSNYIEFCLRKLQFKYSRLELSNVVSLIDDLKTVRNKYKNTNKTAIRKALKENIKIEESDQYNLFYELLIRNLKLRHNVIPTHSLKEIKKIKKLYPDHIKLFVAKLDGNIIAGVVNFVCNTNTVLAFYIAHNDSFQHLRPLNLLFDHMFEWSINNKYKYYDFGLFTDCGIPNKSLARFKENFGTEGMFRKTMTLH